MKVSKKNATNLWQAIEGYAATVEVFATDRNAKEKVIESSKELIKMFEIATGWAVVSDECQHIMVLVKSRNINEP